MGSRLWGTANASSDWDLVIVTTEVSGKTSTHSGHEKIDATLIEPPITSPAVQNTAGSSL